MVISCCASLTCLQMSKVLPAKEFASDEYEVVGDICPRYQKWMKRIKKGDSHDGPCRKDKSHSSRYHLLPKRNSRRKRNRSNQCNEPLVSKKSCTRSSTKPKEKPLRSKSIFFRIGQKGRNFGIRCRTSVELWRKWIKRGIRWERHAPKQADIDIIHQDENKLKDFTKKSIINEIIPEEEESEEGILARPNNLVEAPGGKPNGTSNSASMSSKTNDDIPTKDKNFLTDISYIHKASNLFRHKGKEESKVNLSGNEVKHSNGVTKFAIKDLAAMDIGHIEKIDDTRGSEPQGGQAACKSRPPRGAIHRALNKLKLLF